MNDENIPLPTRPDYLWKFPNDLPENIHCYPGCLVRIKPRGKWLLLLCVIFSECGSKGYIDHSNKTLAESIGEEDEAAIARMLRNASKRRWLVIKGKGKKRRIYFNYNMITKEMVDEDERLYRKYYGEDEKHVEEFSRKMI